MKLILVKERNRLSMQYRIENSSGYTLDGEIEEVLGIGKQDVGTRLEVEVSNVYRLALSKKEWIGPWDPPRPSYLDAKLGREP
jgi:hypothetical protein